MSRFNLPARIFAAASLAIAMPNLSLGKGCGTASNMLRQIEARSKGLPSAKTALIFSALSGRRFTTQHFVVRYTMGRNVHRPRLAAQDSTGVLAKADSIYRFLPSSFTATQRDQSINRGLDSLGAPHPLYIQKVAAYFERAYSYYSDSLAMPMPAGGGSDPFFSTASVSGQYIVDVADITTLDPADGGAVYGLTFSPGEVSPSGSIILENDFLYNAHVDTGNGRVTGVSIKAFSGGAVLHDYAVDWDLGLKVTASHEFYHAIQYVYTPELKIYHAWYELSATGMEERLAPEVNDYFQYLPCILEDHHDLSLLSTSAYEDCGTYPMYGEGIFHQYLTYKFGSRFDKKVWTSLSTNGNNIVGALTSMALSSASRFDTLYASYTSALATAGRAGSSATCTDSTAPIFTRDLHCWPQPSMDSVPAAGTSKTLPVNVLTFRLLKPSTSGQVGVATLTQLSGERRIEKSGANYVTTVSAANSFQIPPSGSVLAWDVPNTSFSQNGSISFVGGTPRYNPVSLSEGQALFFAPAGSNPPLTLTILSESGKQVATLPLGIDQTWTWNLKDSQNRTVPPGVYYYRSPEQQAKTLLIVAP